MNTNSIIVYRSQSERATDIFISEHPAFVLGFVVSLALLLACLFVSRGLRRDS